MSGDSKCMNIPSLTIRESVSLHTASSGGHMTAHHPNGSPLLLPGEFPAARLCAPTLNVMTQRDRNTDSY